MSVKRPSGWKTNADVTHELGVLHADGPEFRTADGELNAWSWWDINEGITVYIDRTDRLFTLAEAIEFRDQFNTLVNKITGEGK